MTAVHQLLPAAAPHDAITGQAFAWRDLLLRWGYESEIVAEHVHPDLMGAVRRLDRKGKRVLHEGGTIVRYAIWSASTEAAFRTDGPRALCYHNITPGELLRDFNPELADLCDRGRDALSELNGRFGALIADSASTPSTCATQASAKQRLFLCCSSCRKASRAASRTATPSC